jgi:hypothetical protein
LKRYRGERFAPRRSPASRSRSIATARSARHRFRDAFALLPGSGRVTMARLL